MTARRKFIFSSLSAAVWVGTLGKFCKAETLPRQFSGIVFSKDNPGRWIGKVGSHVPLVNRDGRRVTITTPHPMSRKHYIVRHTLVLHDGTVAGEKTFFPEEDSRAVSTFTLPEGDYSFFYATSFCNLHDLWITGKKE